MTTPMHSLLRRLQSITHMCLIYFQCTKLRTIIMLCALVRERLYRGLMVAQHKRSRKVFRVSADVSGITVGEGRHTLP
jgi:hypothetical protein